VSQASLEEQSGSSWKPCSVLKAAGSSLEKVVKTTVYLKDMDDFARMNAVYATCFTKDPRRAPPSRRSVAAGHSGGD